MRRFAIIASLVLSSAATGIASAADPAAPAAPCVQPLARMTFGIPGHPDGYHMVMAPGTTANYNKKTELWTISPGDGTAGRITIAKLGEKLTIAAEQVVSPKLPAMRDVLLYDRGGPTCPLDLLPKELQLAS